MNPGQRIQILYSALVFSSNALNILKFSTKTLEFDKSLTTFQDLAVNAYYALYINLATLFDGRKGTPSLEDCIKNNKAGKEIHKNEDLKKLEVIKNKHNKTISKVVEVRKKAVAHVGSDLLTADLSQDSMEVQQLISELVGFYKSLRSVAIDLSKPEIHEYAPKIRDDLGQRELWNSMHEEMLKEMLSSK
jgi:hypothetical protein